MSTRFSGGGVVAEIFRGLKKPMRFSGGGVVAEIFRDLSFFYFPEGGAGPPGPPLNRPLHCIPLHHFTIYIIIIYDTIGPT